STEVTDREDAAHVVQRVLPVYRAARLKGLPPVPHRQSLAAHPQDNGARAHYERQDRYDRVKTAAHERHCTAAEPGIISGMPDPAKLDYETPARGVHPLWPRRRRSLAWAFGPLIWW